MGLLAILLKKGGGIFILISDNPWIMGIGIVILVISLIVKFAGTEEENSAIQHQTNPAKVTAYTLCKACSKKKSDLKRGIYCGETGEKPSFTSICQNFEQKPA